MATELVNIVGKRRLKSGAIEEVTHQSCRVIHNGRQVGVKPGRQDALVVFLPWSDPACHEQVIKELSEILETEVTYKVTPCMPKESEEDESIEAEEYYDREQWSGRQ